MKQTATEYLFEKLWATSKDKFTWQMILKEAKKKEKKQIISAHSADRIFPSIALEEAIQYYQETYEQK